MKILLITILFLTPMMSKADQSIEGRTQQTLEMLNQALATRTYENLSAEIKENVLQHALTALRTIRGDIIRPLPPQAPVPEISFGVKSVAIVETTLLVFHTLDRGQVFQECLAGLAGQGSSFDDITLVSGSQKTQTLHNGSSFWSKQSACELIANKFELSQNFLPRAISVRGRIEKTTINFQGQSNADILEQCFLQVNAGGSTIKRSVDEMYLSIDQGMLKRVFNRASFWNGVTQVCGKVLENI